MGDFDIQQPKDVKIETQFISASVITFMIH